ncbi:MAG: hypothetical protein HYV52_03700 [Parcubacteria group bacterium]|nr:hypothetical protein [Parcubacteria group bacterium]
MPKILVTHINPHLDDIAAFWLFQRFHPDFQDAELKFLSQHHSPTWENKPVDSDLDVIHLGVGRGMFDEHRGLPDESTTSLVWKWLKEKKLGPQEEILEKAIDKFVEQVRLEDTGHFIQREFSLPSVISGLNIFFRDSIKTSKTIFPILDGLVEFLKTEVILDQDWPKRIEFETAWGKGVALESQSRPYDYGYHRGFEIVISLNPVNGWRSIRAKGPSNIDLTPVYGKLKEIDLKTDWYFHHSKKMIINGGDVAPEVKVSRLSLSELIKIVVQSKPSAL